MSIRQQRRILRTLDEPARVLFWQVDEFLMLAAPLILGLILGTIVMSLSGGVLLVVYRKFRRRLPRGKVQAVTYWHMPPSLAKKAGLGVLPPSYIREAI